MYLFGYVLHCTRWANHQSYGFLRPKVGLFPEEVCMYVFVSFSSASTQYMYTREDSTAAH